MEHKQIANDRKVCHRQQLNGGNNNRQIDNGSDYPCKDDHTRFLRKIAMLHPDLLAHHQTVSLISWLSPSTHNACCQTFGQPQSMPCSCCYLCSFFPLYALPGMLLA